MSVNATVIRPAYTWECPTCGLAGQGGEAFLDAGTIPPADLAGLPPGTRELAAPDVVTCARCGNAYRVLDVSPRFDPGPEPPPKQT